MSQDGSKLNLTEHDRLKNPEEKEETTGLLSNLKKKFDFEMNGLFYIILAIIVFALALTISMVLSIFFGPAQIQPHAGVSTEVQECSDLALDLCRKGGSAVDGAIGSFLCVSFVRPDITGLGGCGSLVIHNHTSLKSEVIDFSCVAAPDVKDAGSVGPGYGVRDSVAMPGISSGLKLAHSKQGRLNWTIVMDAVVAKFKAGIKVTPQMEAASGSPEFSKMPANFRAAYSNWTTGKIFYPLESASLAALVKTLRNEGLRTGVDGSLAKQFSSAGFSQWSGKLNTARVQAPLKATFGEYILMTQGLPSKGGLDMALPFLMLDKLLDKTTLYKETALYYHLLVEAVRISQALTSFLGDSKVGTEGALISKDSITRLLAQMNSTKSQPRSHYGPFIAREETSDSGTHIGVVDSYHTYVSLSVGLNSAWGSGIAAADGAVLLNDAVRLFTPTAQKPQPGPQSWPAGLGDSSANVAAPGKRPLHPLAPAMVYNARRQCGVRFVVGANSGYRSASGTLEMVMGAIYLDQNFCPTKDCLKLDTASKRSRLYVNQLSPASSPNSTVPLLAESAFPAKLLTSLQTEFGHTNITGIKELQAVYSAGKVQYELRGYADTRGGGSFTSF